jgi:hypothetical protein
LVYKNTVTTLARTGTLNGILKGNDTSEPTAVAETKNQITYWSETDTIASTSAVSVGLGGTGADLTAVATGGLIYKSGVTTLSGTGQITGALKGNGASAPSVATQADLGPGGDFEQYDQDNVAITGGRIGTATRLRLYNQTWAQLQGITPTAIGQMYFCTTCTPAKIAVSNNTTLGAFVNMTGGALP